MQCAPSVNVIAGVNGSGKTSMLEAISMLSHGRSFRTTLFDPIIQHEQDHLSVFGQVHSCSDTALKRLGVYVSRRKDKLMRIDGARCLSSTLLAKALPLKIIAPHCFSLLEQGPKERRKYFDWLVFYLYPDFADLWKQYNRYLEQRNSVLKRDRFHATELSVWDRKLVELSLALQKMREETFLHLLPVITELAEVFAMDQELSLHLSPGWPVSKDLSVCLQESLAKDRLYGRTSYGAHRFDLVIKHGHLLAKDKLSRGQKKVLIYLLHIAQVILLERLHRLKCVFLLDDLMSELDDHFSRLICECLSHLHHQFFITTTDWQKLVQLDIFQSHATKVFHVEHGAIGECDL